MNEKTWRSIGMGKQLPVATNMFEQELNGTDDGHTKLHIHAEIATDNEEKPLFLAMASSVRSRQSVCCNSERP
jgi:hypothetical protein